MAQTSFLKWLTSSLLTLGAFLLTIISGTGAIMALWAGDTSTAFIGGIIAVIAFLYASYRKFVMNGRDGRRMGRR